MGESLQQAATQLNPFQLNPFHITVMHFLSSQQTAQHQVKGEGGGSSDGSIIFNESKSSEIKKQQQWQINMVALTRGEATLL